jgi:hypothetical protein
MKSGILLTSPHIQPHLAKCSSQHLTNATCHNTSATSTSRRSDSATRFVHLIAFLAPVLRLAAPKEMERKSIETGQENIFVIEHVFVLFHSLSLNPISLVSHSFCNPLLFSFVPCQATVPSLCRERTFSRLPLSRL